jgi:hypothetical protein
MYKNTYIPKLLIKAVTAGIEALVVSGNTFLYACVKEVCRQWAQPLLDNFHQNLTIVEELWSRLALRVGTSKTGDCCSERDQGCYEGGQTTPSFSRRVRCNWVRWLELGWIERRRHDTENIITFLLQLASHLERTWHAPHMRVNLRRKNITTLT